VDDKFARLNSGIGVESQQKALEAGIKVRVGKGTPKTVNGLGSLLEAYREFAQNQVETFRAQLRKLGQPIPEDISPDPFIKFVTERAKINPFALIDPQSAYFLETAQLFDGEMGLQLPGPYPEVPALFFEVVKILRSARAKVRKEQPEKANNGQQSNKHKGRV
jgi:hypothetical protein